MYNTSGLQFSRMSFVNGDVIAYMVGKLGGRSVYFGGSMICLDNEYKFRCYALGGHAVGVTRGALLSSFGWDAPRWCVYDVPVCGRGGRLVGFVSIMSPMIDDGGSLVKVAGMMKEIKAEVAACDLTAAELLDLYSLDARGYLVTVRDANGVQL